MFETNFTNPTASSVKCECGNVLEFVNGWIPDTFYCANCGRKFVTGMNVRVSVPNYDLNKSQEEVTEEAQVQEEIKEENNEGKADSDNA